MKFFDFWLEFPKTIIGLFSSTKNIINEIQMCEKLSKVMKVIKDLIFLGIQYWIRKFHTKFELCSRQY